MVNFPHLWPRLGRVRILVFLAVACALAGMIFLYYQHRTSDLPETSQDISRRRYPRPRHEIRGFHFHGTHEGKRTISIKADRFGIEKKKLAFFRFGLMNVARLTNAVIDIYGKRTESVRSAGPSPAGQKAGRTWSNTSRRQSITFEEVFSGKALPSFPAKRISSIVIEPVLVKLHDETSVVSEISAASATIRMRQRDILFKGDVRVVSGSRVLTTNQLIMLPESAVIKTDRHFVLKTPEKQFDGERLTTNIYLEFVTP